MSGAENFRISRIYRYPLGHPLRPCGRGLRGLRDFHDLHAPPRRAPRLSACPFCPAVRMSVLSGVVRRHLAKRSPMGGVDEASSSVMRRAGRSVEDVFRFMGAIIPQDAPNPCKWSLLKGA